MFVIVDLSSTPSFLIHHELCFPAAEPLGGSVLRRLAGGKLRSVQTEERQPGLVLQGRAQEVPEEGGGAGPPHGPPAEGLGPRGPG